MSVEQREPEDREYEELLRSYRSLPRSEPSARLDAAILGAARSAVARRPAQRKSRWPLGLATAATMILAAGAVLQLQKTRVMPAQQSTEAAPALDAGAAQKKLQSPDAGLAPQAQSGAPATSNAAPGADLSKDRDLAAPPAGESEIVTTGRLSDKHDLGAAAAVTAQSSAPVSEAPAEPIMVPEIMQTESAPQPVLAAPAPAPASAPAAPPPPPPAAPPAPAAMAPAGAGPELPRAPSAALAVPADSAASTAAEPPPAKPVAPPSAASGTPATRGNAADELRDSQAQPRRTEPSPTGASAGSLKQTEPMSVQGSRVKRVDTETAAPVFVIDPPATPAPAPAPLPAPAPALEERKAATVESAPQQAAAKEKSAAAAFDDRKQSQLEDDEQARQRQRERAAGGADGRKLEAAKTAQGAAADWLTEIRRLLAAGERDRARAELRRLQSVYPQEKIPADLADALR